MHGPTIYQVEDSVDGNQWTLEANCRGTDPEIFFPIRKRGTGLHNEKLNQDLRMRVREAVAVCEDCPVKRQCYSRAVAYRVQDGIWGGVFFGSSRVRSEAYNLNRVRNRAMKGMT